MSETENKVWESIPVGDDLGTLDYVLTAQMMADYRRVVDNPHAAYPCSLMPRLGVNKVLTIEQIKDAVALLMSPDSPVNK